MKRFVASGTLCFLCLVASISRQPPRTSAHWVGTWTAASVARLYPPPDAAPPAGASAVPLPNHQTLRQIVRVSIDFDAAVRDPQKPAQIFAPYDSGDHLHPSDAGYQAMGNAIDLALLTSR